MSTARKVLLTVGGLMVALILAAATALYVYGPTATAMYTGNARFFGTDTPKRYASTVLDLASQGIYADSAEFAEASAAAQEEAKHAETLEDIRPALDKAVQAAGGKHSKLIEPGAEQDNASEADTRSPSVNVRDGVAWATVPGVGRHDDGQHYADTLAKGLTAARDGGACGAVVDLRGNDGGDMGPMLAGVSPLLPDGTALEFVSNAYSSPVTIEGNGVRGGGSPTTTSGGKWGAPVAVLVDGDTASSAEATMLAFRGLDNSRSFGVPTAGYASANMVYDFPDGSALMLTIAKYKARTGEIFSEDPVQPDELGDEDAALAWLAEEHGCS